ncbi:MAG: sigma 54-interacting transcriptional regulator [Myxococcaceae bacterium]|nr:sigma 54-interacting transcriptional regulator [Myxococcaceae bacterium]
MNDNTTASRSRRRTTLALRPPARLVTVYPLELAAVHPLTHQTTVFGRSPDTGVAIAHPSVSRAHLELSWDGAHRVKDLDSKHGTSVDGLELDDAPVNLNDGSVVRLADVVMVYEAGRVGASAAPTEAVPGVSVMAGLLRAQVERAATDLAPALILGETGTGKEMVAAELHRLSRRKGPLLAINCAALSPQLVESQLFGHLKGAFTGADQAHQGLFRAANGGTLFLDEVGELPLELQPKLLRAIQQHEVMPVGATQAVKVDVRVVSATNRSLSVDVEGGRFRRDLFARLGLWQLTVPPLRERRADVLTYMTKLHGKWRAGTSGAPLPKLDAEAVEALLLAPWPENLRTLDRLVHELGAPGAPARVTRAARGGGLDAAPARARGAAAGASPAERKARRPSPSKEELLAALKEHKSVRATAKHFGRERRQIYRWLEAYELEWKE